MDRFQSLTTYALIIILIGILVSSLSFYPSTAIQYSVGFGMLLSAIFAGLTAFKCKYLNVPYTYHLLHAGGFLIYGTVILFLGTTSENFLYFTTFFLLYYGISEITFCFQLVMLKRDDINYRLMIYRVVIGLMIGVGSFIIFMIATKDQKDALLASGIVFVFCGINLFLFRTVLKNFKTIS